MLSSPARASLEGAPWGASLDSLRKTFPGGRVSSGEADEVIYAVERHLYEHRAKVSMTVAREKGLVSVSVRFFLDNPTAAKANDTPARQESTLDPPSLATRSHVESFDPAKFVAAADVTEPGPVAPEVAQKALDQLAGQLTRKDGPPLFIKKKGGQWFERDGVVFLAIVDDILTLGYRPDEPVTRALRIGYSDTRWGQSLASARKLYPNGYVNPMQNGDTVYSVVRTIAGFENAVVRFTFAPGKALSSVTVFFPKVGTSYDLVKDEFVPMNDTEKVRAFSQVRSQLISKYGNPTLDEPDAASWGTGEVFLTVVEGGVGIAYTRPGPRTSSGL